MGVTKRVGKKAVSMVPPETSEPEYVDEVFPAEEVFDSDQWEDDAETVEPQAKQPDASQKPWLSRVKDSRSSSAALGSASQSEFKEEDDDDNDDWEDDEWDEEDDWDESEDEEDDSDAFSGPDDADGEESDEDDWEDEEDEWDDEPEDEWVDDSDQDEEDNTEAVSFASAAPAGVQENDLDDAEWDDEADVEDLAELDEDADDEDGGWDDEVVSDPAPRKSQGRWQFPEEDMDEDVETDERSYPSFLNSRTARQPKQSSPPQPAPRANPQRGQQFDENLKNQQGPSTQKGYRNGSQYPQPGEKNHRASTGYPAWPAPDTAARTPQRNGTDHPQKEPPAAVPQRRAPAPAAVGASKEQPADLKTLLQKFQPLPSYAAMFGICDDGLPLMLDLNDPSPGSLLFLGDSVYANREHLGCVLASVCQINSPGQVAVEVITPQPDRFPLSQFPHCKQILSTFDPAAYELLSERFLQAESMLQNPEATSKVHILAIDQVDQVLEQMEPAGLAYFRWLLRRGPEAGIWVMATLNGSRQDQVDLKTARAFGTYVVGFTRAGELCHQLTRIPPAQAARLRGGKQACMNIGGKVTQFNIPGRC